MKYLTWIPGLKLKAQVRTMRKNESYVLKWFSLRMTGQRKSSASEHSSRSVCALFCFVYVRMIMAFVVSEKTGLIFTCYEF